MTTIKELQDSNKIIYTATVGSHAYGTNNKDSDIDKCGFFIDDFNSFKSVFECPETQISDDKNNVNYYSVKRAFELLSKSNPNITELLWIPDDCIEYKNDLMQKIIDNRDIFVSKSCFETHSGYAYAQIKKAKGSNKKVHNPQPEERPKKEDFCWIIPFDRDVMKAPNRMPCRPIPVNEMKFLDSEKVSNPDIRPTKNNGYGSVFHSEMDLSQFHVSSVEHSHNVYRLYYYGEKSKGVFRGDDMLVCESIPKDEEQKCVGLLIYNKDEYNKAIREWNSYWDWIKHRNSSRWVDQEKGNLDYDQKNMMHCVRLLMSGENILRNGEPIVRFTGERLKYLMDIRNGKLTYDEIMKDVEERMNLLKVLNDTSSIPTEVDKNKIEDLYKSVISDC